jgi:hypothetical protein
MAPRSTTKSAPDDPGVAKDSENAKLAHSEGGTTTRDDATDVGVPMLPGSPDEPVGPEDALGEGPTRGDYRDRIGGPDYHPHEAVANPDAEDGEPAVKVVPQRPRAEEIGDVPGKKGGVETAGESA